MNIYYSIKNPIRSNWGLYKIVDAYLSDKKESFYCRAVGYGQENSKFDDEEFFKFKDKIDSLEFDRIRKLDEKDVKKYNFINSNKFLKGIYEAIMGYTKVSECPTYNQYKLVMKYSNKELLSKYRTIKGKNNLSKEDKLVVKLIENYNNKRHVFDYLAGYHVYGSMLEKYADVEFDELKYKIYLNLPYDQLYKFAEKFMDVCRDKKIAYTFKVLSPISDIPDRSEKMCIYCDKKNFYKTIDICNAIKSANPELNPKKPPIMAGILDDWIGIGSDPKRGESYNKNRARCIEKALDKYFSGMSNSDARKQLKDNPNILSEIREAIMKESDEMEIATNKFCFTKIGNVSIKEEGKNYSRKKIQLDYKKLRIYGLKGKGLSENSKPKSQHEKSIDKVFPKYAQARIKYGKNSKEVSAVVDEYKKTQEKYKDKNNNYTKGKNVKYSGQRKEVSAGVNEYKKTHKQYKGKNKNNNNNNNCTKGNNVKYNGKKYASYER